MAVLGRCLRLSKEFGSRVIGTAVAHRLGMPGVTQGAAVVRRVLGNLPATGQLVTASPYLDARLYAYDERVISPMVRFV
jgi:hypothetical protein